MSFVRLTVEVEVVDEDELREYAVKQYARCWPGETPPGSLPLLVLEAMVLSNENPSPNEYGVEIHEYSAEVIRG